MTTIQQTRTARAQRRATRQRAHHLVTADEQSLLELETYLATLPICATGRVFIEVACAKDVSFISAPARMTVTWLVRERRSGAPGTSQPCPRGAAVARAACAWANEMLCDDETMADTTVTLLGGFLGTADIAEHLTQTLEVPMGRIYAPERFGLATRLT